MASPDTLLATVRKPPMAPRDHDIAARDAPGAVRGHHRQSRCAGDPDSTGSEKTLRPTVREVLSSPKSAQVPGCAQAFHTICERITR
jgi:hypothetical protein